MTDHTRAWRMLHDLKERKRRRLDDEAAAARAALARADEALARSNRQVAASDEALHAHTQRIARAMANGQAIAADAYLADARYRDVLNERCTAAREDAERAREARDASQRTLDDTRAQLARTGAQADWYARREARERREAQAARDEADEEEAMEGVIDAARRRRAQAAIR
ncbi:hypothetical protein CUJ89_35825 [Burkholderia pyrrocinia]|uniref:Uncharacterized protein n=1 Tax=Burkholderia pyrrocinia TaxID=60550 RepID=A0A2Z5N8C7_BURPY|nr:hypothetical protein [Burkholderia pyrrocinia]AXF25785.1 hypothetical protein CUJ89_35825 [Burkholderia pyrrocinia]